MRTALLAPVLTTLALVALVLFGPVRPAAAQTDLVGPDTLSGVLDLRLDAADGEDSFLRGGYGKTEVSGARGGVAVRPALGLAALAWRPEVYGDLSAYVLAESQTGQYHAVDLAEAYLLYKPLPRSALLHYALRAGLMWPPASLEHDGPAWTVTRTLTPSAIDTWIAEEVKTAGVEASIGGEYFGQRLDLTAAAFGDNDTAGTLLAYRGWALDDIRSTLFAEIPMPQGPPRFEAYAAEPSTSLDSRAGIYAKLDWRPPAPIALQAFYYDNNGDPHVFKDGQWDWRTRFGDLGLTAHPGWGVEVLGQVLKGESYYGGYGPGLRFVDVKFASAYLLVTRRFGRSRFTVRADWFDVQDQLDYLGGAYAESARDERGKAGTVDYAYALTHHLSLWLEGMHVWSNHPSRAMIGLPPTETQNVLRVALRASL